VWHATQASKRKRRSKALPVLGAAAGLSLSLASGASAAPGGPAVNMLTRNTLLSHEITLREEEEVSDVSLATFYAVNKENAGTFRPPYDLHGRRLRRLRDGLYEASTLGSDANLPHRSIKPAQRYTHALKRTHVPKNP
jgi:hypothetical protein